jgi:H+/Cl- antiporter ClcA
VWIIKFGAGKVVSEKLLLCTAFARMFLLGVSMNCGFVGGIIFPFLTMGMLAGTICYLHYDFLPLGLCVGTFMIAVPSGIVPMPFTLTCLSVFLFYFGLYQVVPIFIASFTAYLIVCGSGLFKKLSSRANAKNGESEADLESESKQTEIAKQEADDFALKQYLGNKKNATTEAINSSHR